MGKRLNISTARRDLPSLFDRVVIRRRGDDREAVLVDREYLESLEAASRRPAPEFRLLDSGETLADVEEAIAGIRAADGQRADQRRGEMVPHPGRR